MTTSKNSILNPDVVEQWAKDEPHYVQHRLDRACALLPAVRRLGSHYPATNGTHAERAERAVKLWQDALPSAQAVVQKNTDNLRALGLIR